MSLIEKAKRTDDKFDISKTIISSRKKEKRKKRMVLKQFFCEARLDTDIIGKHGICEIPIIRRKHWIYMERKDSFSEENSNIHKEILQ